MTTESYDRETMQAIIQEARRQGFADDAIAQRLQLSTAETARLADTDLQEQDQQLDGLIRMVEAAQEKLAAYGHGWTLRPKLSPTFNLAVLGRELGAEGVIDFVQGYFRVCGCLDLPATSLNLPRKFVHGCCRREAMRQYH